MLDGYEFGAFLFGTLLGFIATLILGVIIVVNPLENEIRKVTQRADETQLVLDRAVTIVERDREIITEMLPLLGWCNANLK